jgi:SSS family solute:Na+ symporter
VIVVGGLGVSLYTVFGGIEAVVWTDVVQTFILLGGGILCLGLMVWEIPGGLGQVIDLGVEYHKFGLGPVKFDLNERTFFAVLLLGLVNFTSEYASNQNVVQRYIAAKSLREARKATLICMFMSVPTWMGFFFLGSCLFAFYHVFPEAAVTAMAADEVLPHFILTKTPPFVGGTIIAACLAAAMSSQSSSINAISTICTVDFAKRFGRARSDREYLTIAKVTAGIASLLMIGGAIVICYIPKESINDFSLIIGSLFGGGVLSIFLLGFFTTRVGYHAVLLGTGVALACNVYLMLNTFGWLPEALKLPVHSYWTTIIVNAVLLPVGYGASLFRPNRRNLNRLTVWTMERSAKRTSRLIPAGVKEP